MRVRTSSGSGASRFQSARRPPQLLGAAHRLSPHPQDDVAHLQVGLAGRPRRSPATTCTPRPPGSSAARERRAAPAPRSPRRWPPVSAGRTAAVPGGGACGWPAAPARVVTCRSSGSPVAQQAHLHPRRRAAVSWAKMRKSSRVASGCSPQAVHHVAHLAGPPPRPADRLLDRRHQRAPQRWAARRPPPARRDRLALDAQERPRRLARLAQPGQQQLDHVDGDGEAHPGRRLGPAPEGGVDPDDRAAGVDQRPARVAHVDRGVGLDVKRVGRLVALSAAAARSRARSPARWPTRSPRSRCGRSRRGCRWPPPSRPPAPCPNRPAAARGAAPWPRSSAGRRPPARRCPARRPRTRARRRGARAGRSRRARRARW